MPCRDMLAVTAARTLIVCAGLLLTPQSLGADSAEEPTGIRSAAVSTAGGPAPVQLPPGRTTRLALEHGDSLIGVLTGNGIDSRAALDLAGALKGLLEPARLQPGTPIRLTRTGDASDQGPRLQRLTIGLDPDREVVVVPDPASDGFQAYRRRIPHDRRIEVAAIRIRESLYASARSADVPSGVILQAYRVLATRMDLQRELRTGDRVTLAWQQFDHARPERDHPGKAVAVRLEQRARALAMYRFDLDGRSTGFFDLSGASVATTLLRTPVRGGQLSSAFGQREHPVLDYTRMHEGLDFAAARGTPVVAAGDGRVTRARRFGSYGRYVRIAHDSELSTAYAHLSLYADGVASGTRVKQGEVIGYVGASGLTTGPNLHYEVLRDGQPVDPSALELPPKRRLDGADLRAFEARRQRLDRFMARHVALNREDEDVIPGTVGTDE